MRKAEKIRKQTGNSKFYAPLEREAKKSLSERLNHILAKPFKVLFQEPMLIALTVYMSVSFSLYGLMQPTEPLLGLVRIWLRLPSFRGVSCRLY